MVETVPETRRRHGFGRELGYLFYDTWTIAKRQLTHIRYMPEKLADVTIQPIIFVFMFAYIFGSAIAVPGGNYRDYLMPGIFAQTMAFSSISIMGAVANDMGQGFMDRLRSLPINRGAVIIGDTLSSLVESLLGLAVMTGCALVVGWRPTTGAGSIAEAYVMLLLFGFSMTWVGAFLGLFLRSAESAQGIGALVIFPLTFVANTFVPTAGMPAILRTIANWNPMSAVVEGVRELFGNQVAPAPGIWTLAHPDLATVAWCALVVAVFLPLAVLRFRKALAR